MPFEPRGLESQKHPLKHQFSYGFALSAVTTTQNSFWATICRNTKQCVTPTSVLVNPHNADMDVDTGTACYPMSIIQNIRISILMTKSQANNQNYPSKMSVTPFFCSFENKYDAKDAAGVTMTTVMSLTKDATNEDIVPLTTNNLPAQGNELLHPVTTVGFSEVFGDLNMTNDLIVEDAPFDKTAFQLALTTSTMRGALKSCLGKTRHYSFSINAGRKSSESHSLFIKKSPPRSVRRMVPFSYFGFLFHVPVETDKESYQYDTALTAAKGNIGVKMHVRFDEWNEEFSNAM